MIVPDVNLLVYAYNDGAPEFDVARQWWEKLMVGDETIGLPWVVTTGFVRLMANPSSVASPLAPTVAADHVRHWFLFPHVIPINPGLDHLAFFRQVLDFPGSGHNIVTDAHIAALAIEHKAEVHSADRHFGRFPGVRWHNPLA